MFGFLIFWYYTYRRNHQDEHITVIVYIISAETQGLYFKRINPIVLKYQTPLLFMYCTLKYRQFKVQISNQVFLSVCLLAVHDAGAINF